MTRLAVIFTAAMLISACSHQPLTPADRAARVKAAQDVLGAIEEAHKPRQQMHCRPERFGNNPNEITGMNCQ